MATNLYETLEVSVDATPEQIRKAYKKRALQTHPDRLRPGVSAPEKAAAEERFRQVNNAYEVLSDPQNRRVYDLHGVWPPPEPTAGPSEPRRPDMRHAPFFNEPFREPFFNMNMPRMSPFDRQHHHRPQTFTFTDPFTLFNSMFGDIHQLFDHDAFFDDPFQHNGPPRSMFEQSHPFFAPPPMFSIPMFPEQSFEGSRPRRTTYSSTSRLYSHGGPDVNGPRWVEESHMTRTINGVTQSISKQRDSSGNEHITYEYPDGRKRYTINGIEQQQQQPQQELSGPGTGPSLRHDRVIPPLPPSSTHHMQSGIAPSFARSPEHLSATQQSQNAAFYPYADPPIGGHTSSGHSKRFRPYSNGSGSGLYSSENIKREREQDQRNHDEGSSKKKWWKRHW